MGLAPYDCAGSVHTAQALSLLFGSQHPRLVPACPGVTGSRVTMESRVEGLISMLHEVTDKSVAVGFGISAPDAV